AVVLAVDDLGLIGPAASRGLALDQVLRALHRAAVLEGIEPQARAVEAVAVALQAHAALALHAAEIGVVAQQVAEDREVVAADLRIAARGHLQVADALDRLGVDGGGALRL